MGAFLVFLLILILLIVFIAFSLINSVLKGISTFLGFGGNQRRNFSNTAASGENSRRQQSEEGSNRMRRFKNAAEDTDFEMVEI